MKAKTQIDNYNLQKIKYRNMANAGIKHTVDDVTRTDTCRQDICLRDMAATKGPRFVAAALTGLDEDEIQKAEMVGSCEGCKFYRYINKESF